LRMGPTNKWQGCSLQCRSMFKMQPHVASLSLMSPFYDPSKTRCPEIGPKWGLVEVAARAMALLDTKCLLEIFLLLYISCQKVCQNITSCIEDQWPALSQLATKTPSAINKLSTQLFSLFPSRFSPTNISDVQGPRRGIGKRALEMSLF
jgi:hypothetical protein